MCVGRRPVHGRHPTPTCTHRRERGRTRDPPHRPDPANGKRNQSPTPPQRPIRTGEPTRSTRVPQRPETAVIWRTRAMRPGMASATSAFRKGLWAARADPASCPPTARAGRARRCFPAPAVPLARSARVIRPRATPAPGAAPRERPPASTFRAHRPAPRCPPLRRVPPMAQARRSPPRSPPPWRFAWWEWPRSWGERCGGAEYVPRSAHVPSCSYVALIFASSRSASAREANGCEVDNSWVRICCAACRLPVASSA